MAIVYHQIISKTPKIVKNKTVFSFCYWFKIKKLINKKIFKIFIFFHFSEKVKMTVRIMNATANF